MFSKDSAPNFSTVEVVIGGSNPLLNKGWLRFLAIFLTISHVFYGPTTLALRIGQFGTVSQRHPNFPTDDHFHIILSSSCRARYVCLSLVSSIQAPPPSLTYVGIPVWLQAKDGNRCRMGLNTRSNKQTKHFLQVLKQAIAKYFNQTIQLDVTLTLHNGGGR